MLLLLVDLVGVVSFNNSVYAYNETLTKANTANIGLLLTYINRMVAEGSVKTTKTKLKEELSTNNEAII